MTSEKRFKQKFGIFDAFHAGFVVPLAAFLDGEGEEEEDDAVADVEIPKPAKPKPKPALKPKEEPAPTREEAEVAADDNADAE